MPIEYENDESSCGHGQYCKWNRSVSFFSGSHHHSFVSSMLAPTAVAMAPEVHPFTAAAQSIEEQDGWTGVLE